MPALRGGETRNLKQGSSFSEDIFSAAGEPTFAFGGPTDGPCELGPSVRSVKSTLYEVDGFPKHEETSIHEMDGEEASGGPESMFSMGFRTSAEGTVQDLEVFDDHSPNAPEDSVTSENLVQSSSSLEPICKKLFKLMQIENDNQDLSFVEKVILSRDEIFRLCSNITPKSVMTSDGKRSIDFKSLNATALKVVGFFGDKDIMRGILRNQIFEDENEVWMQIQNDTLAPGLYGCRRDESVFVFYWHQGHSLPKATRKDMSCNFIRYVFDLCDTVCVCLEGSKMQASLSGSVPRFSKHKRNQRLQIALVKASDDSVEVKSGFLLNDLPLRPGAGLPSKKDGENLCRDLVSGQEYKLSEGGSRVALLSSSPRPPKLTTSKLFKEVTMKDFPAFFENLTKESGYGLDLKELSDTEFVDFIHCAKLNVADEYDKLLSYNKLTLEDLKNEAIVVDQLVEEQQQSLFLSVSNL